MRFTRAIVIVLDSVGVGELPDAGDVRRPRQQHARQPRACRSSQHPHACSARHRAGRHASRSARAGVAALGVRQNGGKVRRQRFGDRPLGADGDCARSRVPHVSQRISSGVDRRVRTAHRPPGARQRRRLGHRDPRSARPPNTSRPAGRLFTRRPTASFRSPRTKTSSPSPSSTSGARLPTS